MEAKRQSKLKTTFKSLLHGVKVLLSTYMQLYSNMNVCMSAQKARKY